MGKAQKIKKMRKMQKEIARKQSGEKRKIFFVTILTILIVAVGGYFANKWYVNNLKKPDVNPKVVMHTSEGDIKLELYKKAAPKTVENFLGHVKNNYYNQTLFHRVIKDFMIQGGDPNTKSDDVGKYGMGGESIWGGKFEDEINASSLGIAENDIVQLEQLGYKYNSSLQSYKIEPGVIAMANSGPNTNGSQFFIVTEKSQPTLDGRHTVFGKVIDGMDTVGKIALVEVGENDLPNKKVVINSIEIIEESSTDEKDVTISNQAGDMSSPIQLEEIDLK